MLEFNRKILAGGALLAGAAVMISASIHCQASLADFNHRVIQASTAKEKEAIALKAVEELVRAGVPDSIVAELERSSAKVPQSVALVACFPALTSEVTDSLCAIIDTALAEFARDMRQLRRADSTAFSNSWLRAVEVAQLVDNHRQQSYWLPLLRFLSTADAATWHRWQMAKKADGLANNAIRATQFDRAQQFSLAGLQQLIGIPDRRLYLDLCSRLQNALAEGDAVYNLSFALGESIAEESLQIGHYLRYVGIHLNLGNQALLNGRYDEAIAKLVTALSSASKWHYVNLMDYYPPNILERLAKSMFRIGEYQTAIQYMATYDSANAGVRQRALYEMSKGMLAEINGDFEAAEISYQHVILLSKEDDPINAWYAHVNLVMLFLRYDVPDKAMVYLEDARNYAAETKLLNAERSSILHQFEARIAIQLGQNDKARRAMVAAESFGNKVDSPRLMVDNLVNAAEIYTALGEFDEAYSRLDRARFLCRAQNSFLKEIDIILNQVRLSVNQPRAGQKAPPIEELQQVLSAIRKINDKPLLIRASALLLTAAYKDGQLLEAHSYGQTLLHEVEKLSQLYDQEERLVFFQHSMYRDIKSAIELDIFLNHEDSAFVELDYAKGRALRKRLGSQNVLLDDLKRALQQDEALISYMVTPDTLHVFVLTSDDLQQYSLGAKKSELQAQVDQYLALLQDDLPLRNYDDQVLAAHYHRAVEAGRQLYKELFGAHFDQLRGLKHLYIVPDEFLHALPFNTLVTNKEGEPRFLVEKMAIMTLPGAWALSQSPPRHAAHEKASVLASLVPELHGTDALSARLVELFGNHAEIRTNWTDKHELLQELERNRGICLFFAHAEARWDDPQESFIAFSTSDRRHDRLFYRDIDQLDLSQTSLVILAACETIGSRIYLGAGHSGLQRALVAAGAQQVLATHWKVDAALVAEQINEFLVEWKNSRDALTALQISQVSAIARLRHHKFFRYPHPHLWGAYNLTGIKVQDNRDTLSVVHVANN